jgi:hypothetical protein
LKARIEIEIDDDSLSDEELKKILIEELALLMESWLTGESIVMIEFVDASYNYEHNWIRDDSIN